MDHLLFLHFGFAGNLRDLHKLLKRMRMTDIKVLLTL